MITFTHVDDDGNETELRLPSVNVVCWRCDGNGTHVNPSIDGNGITSDEMYELGDDFREDYLSGAYDVLCSVCGGHNVVAEVDEDHADPKILALYRQQLDDDYAYEQLYAAERRFGC